MSTHRSLSWIETVPVRRQIEELNWEEWRNECIDKEALPLRHGWQMGNTNMLIEYATYAAHWPPLCPYYVTPPPTNTLCDMIEAIGLHGDQVNYFYKCLLCNASRWTTLIKPMRLPESDFMDDVQVLHTSMYSDILNTV